MEYVILYFLMGKNLERKNKMLLQLIFYLCVGCVEKKGNAIVLFYHFNIPPDSFELLLDANLTNKRMADVKIAQLLFLPPNVVAFPNYIQIFISLVVFLSSFLDRIQ